MRYFDLLLERFKEREKYLKNLDYYLNIIKKFFKEKFGDDSKIYLFGSYLTGNFGPNSDVDTIVEKLKIVARDHDNDDRLIDFIKHLSIYQSNNMYGNFFNGKSNINFGNDLSVVHLRTPLTY